MLQPKQHQQPQITQEEFMAKSTEVLCTCGSKYFKEAFGLRKLSRIAFPELPKDAIQPIPVFVCISCNRELKIN